MVQQHRRYDSPSVSSSHRTVSNPESSMNGLAGTSLDLQDTKRLRASWKSKVQKYLIQSPLSWRKVNRQAENEAGRSGESLQTLISHKCGRRAFRRFLKSEFCEENLDFWLACERFKTCDSPEELTQRAAAIYDEFVKAESCRQVNLDFYTRELIGRSLPRPSPSCFAAAQKRIYSLMENDSFPRFILSESYRVLRDGVSKGPRRSRHFPSLQNVTSAA